MVCISSFSEAKIVQLSSLDIIHWLKAAKIMIDSGRGNFYCLINNIIEGHNSILANKYPKRVKYAKLGPRYG